jgi:hypothetical protein
MKQRKIFEDQCMIDMLCHDWMSILFVEDRSTVQDDECTLVSVRVA